VPRTIEIIDGHINGDKYLGIGDWRRAFDFGTSRRFKTQCC
jgi:hypothetical protein